MSKKKKKPDNFASGHKPFFFFSVLRSIMTDLYYLSQADGVGEWRVKEAKDLSDLVQNRITYLQVRTAPPSGPAAGSHTCKHTTTGKPHDSTSLLFFFTLEF